MAAGKVVLGGGTDVADESLVAVGWISMVVVVAVGPVVVVVTAELVVVVDRAGGGSDTPRAASTSERKVPATYP